MSEFILDEIVQMRADKISWNKIADHYGAWRQRMFNWIKQQPNVPEWIFEPLPGGKKQPGREDLESMMKEGLDDRQMAHRLDMNLEALQRLRLRRGLMRGEPGIDRTPKSDTELAGVKALLDAEHMSLRAASEVTGVGYNTVRRHFPEYAFTTEETVEAALMGRQLSRIAA